MSQVIEKIVYFEREGRANLTDCLELSFETALKYGLRKIVIFTGHGDGIQEAIDDFLSQPNYSEIGLVGVTFAQGFEVRKAGDVSPHVFPEDRKRLFASHGIPIVRAHLPFDAIPAQYQQTGVLAQDMSIVGNALNVFCGSMNLCVQAVLMACDAGEIDIGEHVVVMTSDTALLVRAAPTARLLTDFIVRQIICKPAFLTVIKAETLELTAESKSEQASIALSDETLKQLDSPGAQD